jgi:hypothetical protein
MYVIAQRTYFSVVTIFKIGKALPQIASEHGDWSVNKRSKSTELSGCRRQRRPGKVSRSESSSADNIGLLFLDIFLYVSSEVELCYVCILLGP